MSNNTNNETDVQVVAQLNNFAKAMLTFIQKDKFYSKDYLTTIIFLIFIASSQINNKYNFDGIFEEWSNHLERVFKKNNEKWGLFDELYMYRSEKYAELDNTKEIFNAYVDDLNIPEFEYSKERLALEVFFHENIESLIDLIKKMTHNSD